MTGFERNKILTTLRKEGIYKYNESLLKSGKQYGLLSQRKLKEKSPLVICSNCKAYYSRKYFWSHRKRCKTSAIALPSASITPSNSSEDFYFDILRRFRSDEIGLVCKNDPVILQLGKVMYNKMKRKKDKVTEVQKSVMCDMRRMATLYCKFRKTQEDSSHTNDAGEMLKRSNFNNLTKAIEELTSNGEQKMKAGLKISLFYLLKKMAKIVEGNFLINGNDEKADEVVKFVRILNHNKDFIFGDAVYELNKSRQVNLRKPDQLPLEEDVKEVRDYQIKRINELLHSTANNSTDWTPADFVEIRDLAASRVTMFNARRGGEPARLLLSEWVDAVNGSWIDKQAINRLDESEKRHFKDMKITFQTGKGNDHLVPVLFPIDTLKALKVLANERFRTLSTVNDKNLYLFPCIQQSLGHISGWHTVQKVCRAAKIQQPQKLTATSMRHRASTIYASMDIPERERILFYKHMGHSALVNSNVYQTPLAVEELRKVGKRLVQMDDQTYACKDKNVKEPEEPHDVITDEFLDVSTCPTTSIVKSKDKNVKEPKVSRPYTRWTKKDTSVVVNHFSEWIHGEGLPRKRDIIPFLKNTSLQVTWEMVRTKVLNEQRAAMKRMKKALTTLSP